MADNILRLRVQSDEYDAKLKKAAEGIRHLAEVAHKGGGELTGLEKAELDYVKALGSMETKSRTAAGGVRELESVFKELTVVYNHLNDVEKQDEGGRALRESLDQIRQRAQEARKELENASKALGDVDAKPKGGFFDGLGSKMDGALAVFGGNLLTKGVSMLTSELAGSVQQSIELAKQGEGIRMAFERLNQLGLLDNLKEATHGTVSEVELMKQAIKFENFKLPVEDLANYLAFAQQKAKDTGESVDFLVNSIVNGLGRQSKQILDNLGISAAELTRRMNEGATMTQAVSDIIREEMAKAGDYVETAADRAARAAADTQNKMEELGRSAMPVAEEFASAWAEIRNGAMTLVLPVLSSVADSIRDIREILAGEWDMPKLKPGITNLAEGPANSNQPKRPTWGDVPVVKAPGGYVEVTDNSGKVLHGGHYDNDAQLQNMKRRWNTLTTPTRTSGSRSNTKKEQTELQQNQKRINDLTQKYVDLMSEASRESKPLTNEQRDRAASIKKEIRDLERRNGQLKLYQEQAKGKFLGSGAFKQQLEVDVAVNNKKIEELEKQLINLDGITIDPKSVTITATDEALPKLREIQGITIDDKTTTVTAETADALRALQGINGITIDDKTVAITADDKTQPEFREVESIKLKGKKVAVTADDKTQPEFREVEGIKLKGKKVTITADDKTQPEFREVEGIKLKGKKVTITADDKTQPEFREVDGIKLKGKKVTITADDKTQPEFREVEGIKLKGKKVAITADDKTQPEFREVEGIRLKGKKVAVTADTMEALRAVQGINGITIDPKTVTITATDDALPKLREIQGITIDDKTMNVTAETADALRALQGIEGVTIDPKTVTITATDEALPKLREIQGITIDDKTTTVTAETADALQALQGIEGVTIDPKTVTITATDDALPKLREIQGVTIDPKTVTITATDEALPKLREIQGIRLKGKTVAITADDKTQPEFREVEGIKLKGKKVAITADTMEALRAVQGINGISIDPKTVTITATDEALPKLREIQGITIDEKTVAITADDKTQPEFREVEGIRLKGKKVTVTADTMDALRAVQGINGISIDPKTVTITATDEALPKLREIQGITIDEKTMNVTAETADALRALQGIEGVTIDPKTVTITATDDALPKLREIQGVTIDEKTVAITADDKTQPEFREVEGIRLKGKKVAITADDKTQPEFREVEGIRLKGKKVAITADDKTQPEFREVEGIKLKGKKVTITADDKTQPEFREVEGIRLKGKKVTITADDKTQPEFREVEGIKLKGKKVTVTADTQEALQALQGIEGVTVDTKTVKVTAETDEARQKVEELKRQIAELKDQNIMITAAMGSIGMPLSETPRMGVTDVTYGKGKNQFVPAPLMPTMDDVVRQRGGNLLDEKAMKAVNNDLYGDKKDKSDKNTTKSLLNGISQLTDGLEKIGIDVPDEIQAVIGVIQGVMQVIEAVNAIIGVTQTTALAANTAAMVSLEAALWANTASSFGFFSNGGIVPKFADGGMIGKAALGIAIPGNSLSGDNLRLPVDGGRGVIGVNSGEVILNRAQQGVIASALDGGGAQDIQLSATIRGEDIRLAINNNGRRTGRGEYVQSTRRR